MVTFPVRRIRAPGKLRVRLHGVVVIAILRRLEHRRRRIHADSAIGDDGEFTRGRAVGSYQALIT